MWSPAWALCALLALAPARAWAEPPLELPRVRLQLRLQGFDVAPGADQSAPSGALGAAPDPGRTVASLALEIVWTLRGPLRVRSRVPSALEPPWERELRALEVPDLRPDLDPVTLETP